MSFDDIPADILLRTLLTGSKQAQVFEVLVNREWHCRPCDFSHIQMDQIAGGGGIQGLQRGTKTRPGIEIESRTAPCAKCGQSTRQDRWTGRGRYNAVAGDLPPKLKARVADLYGLRDPLTGTRLKAKDVIVDHRLPRQRWGSDYEPPMSPVTAVHELKVHYQVLRNTKNNNENLRKSRACERCVETGQRQSPLKGVEFFYQGEKDWPNDVPREGAAALEGCRGCGWFDIEAWLDSLNRAARQARVAED